MPHIHEKIDFTAQAFIVCKNKVLLHKHSKYDVWIGVGGHVELDENPNQAVIREVKEEVGLDIDLIPPPDFKPLKLEDYEELVPPHFMNIHKINDTHWHIGMEYFGISKTDRVVPEHPDFVFQWLAKEEIEKKVLPFADRIQEYALAALKAASQK